VGLLLRLEAAAARMLLPVSWLFHRVSARRFLVGGCCGPQVAISFGVRPKHLGGSGLLQVCALSSWWQQKRSWLLLQVFPPVPQVFE